MTQNYCPSGNSNPNCNGSGVLADQNLAAGYVYDLAGNQTQAVNPRGIVEYTAHDALERAIAITENCQTVPTPPAVSCGTQSADQNVLSQQTFDQLGNVLTTTDPLGRINTVAYDALGRKISATQNYCPSGNNNPNCSGSGISSSQNLSTNWQVDAQGNVLKETSPRQCTTSAPCYQGSGNPITDNNNLATGYTYDGLLRLASVIEDQGTVGVHENLTTWYAYDPSGHTLSQTDGRGYTTGYTIDNLGRTTKVTDAGGNVEQTNYSLAGEVVSTVNARGKTNADTLNRVGRLIGVAYFDSSNNALSRSYAYDADGNQTCFSAGDCSGSDSQRTLVTYDHLNRVSTVTAPSPYGTTSYSYFLDGAVNTIADANGTTTFTEDHLGRISTMADPVSGGTTSYSFDAAGRLSSRTEANGIVTTASYTGADQLASKTEVAGSATLASWTNVSYDLAQNRTAETLTYYTGDPYPDPQAGTATYQYDTLNQLSQANVPGKSAANFGYDLAHNLTADAGTTLAYNNNESLQTVGGTTVGSDADGNQTKDLSGNSLSWNSLSELDKFATSETYTYDALGRLQTVTNGSNVTKFVYQGVSGQAIQELSASNSVIRSYAWDSTGRQLYAKSGSSVWYEITDPHGDVAALATATALAGSEHFDPWGNLYSSSGSTIPYGFQGSAGSWTDSTTGLVSMGVRWYYPKVSRFLSSDPAAGTADPRTPIDRLRWLYGANNPIAESDPNGLLAAAEMSGGCDAACQAQNAAAAAAHRPSQSHGAGSSWLKIGGYDVGQHLGNGMAALGGVGSITATPPDLGWLQNGMVDAGNALPGPLRDAFVLQTRINAGIVGGATNRLQNDASRLTNYIKSQATDWSNVADGVSHGDWGKAYSALNRINNRGNNAALSTIQGVSQLNPPTLAINAFNYGVGVVNTWQAQGANAAFDQVSYDFGYNVVGGGAEVGLVTGLTLGAADILAPEAVVSETFPESTTVLRPVYGPGAATAGEPAITGNLNPFAGPVSDQIFVVDPSGNAIPVNPGEYLTGSPDSTWIQVRDANGEPTGMRIDGPHWSHADSRALVRHAHVPGIVNDDGTPWLPVN